MYIYGRKRKLSVAASCNKEQKGNEQQEKPP